MPSENLNSKNIPLLTVGDGPFKLSYANLEFLWNRFNRRVSGFKDFNNPGPDMKKNEIDFKKKILGRYNEEIGETKLQEMVNEGKGQEALKETSKILTANLVNFHSWTKTFGDSDQYACDIFQAFLDVTSKTYEGPGTVKPIFEAIAKHNLKASWDVVSVLLWAMRPDQYFFIKIKHYRELAKELDLKLSTSGISPDKFDDLINFGLAFKKALAPLEPMDWIDVQSFIWCVCPKSYSTEDQAMENNPENNSKIEEVRDKIFNDGVTKINYPSNMILYGPPGTGKTYALRNEYMKRFTESQIRRFLILNRQLNRQQSSCRT